MKEGIEGQEQKGFKFNPSYLTEKTSIDDYTPEEVERFNRLISQAHAEHRQLSPESLHFLTLQQKNVSK